MTSIVQSPCIVISVNGEAARSGHWTVQAARWGPESLSLPLDLVVCLWQVA